MDEAGKGVRDVKVVSEPDALPAVVTKPTDPFKRIGVEAGPLSQWLFSALAEIDLPVISRDPAHAAGVEGPDYQDRPQRWSWGRPNDARVGLYRPVLVSVPDQ